MERAVSDLFEEPDDATPLAPGERDALLQTGSRIATISMRRSRKTSLRTRPGQAVGGATCRSAE